MQSLLVSGSDVVQLLLFHHKLCNATQMEIDLHPLKSLEELSTLRRLKDHMVLILTMQYQILIVPIYSS